MKSGQIMKDIWNASLPESIDFDAMVKFYRTATENQIQKMKNAIKNNDWQTFKKLIKNSGVRANTNSCLPPPTNH